jgi:nitrite reductase/ring-hydroxylating ferredoxin subunit
MAAVGLASIGATGGSIGYPMRPMMASSGSMRDLGRRLLIGLAVVAAAVMAIGYAFIAGRIAAPIESDLGTFERPGPEAGGAQAVLLADGRPAFIVTSEDEVTVVDARGRHAAGAAGRLVAWCEEGVFIDLVGGATYAPDGQLLGGPAADGLVVYPVRSVDDGSRFVVGGDGVSAGSTAGEPAALDCPSNRWIRHRPEAGETFDPSVAADEEPPGWIWLEGRLRAETGETILCDGLDGDCATFAPVGGIDPARVPGGEALAGSFIGRVRDGVIVDLNFVPDPGGPS